jgi:hypothetical protein
MSRVASLGQLAIWIFAGATAVGGFVAGSIYLRGLPLGIIITYALIAALAVIGLVAVIAHMVRSRSRAPAPYRLNFTHIPLAPLKNMP